MNNQERASTEPKEGCTLNTVTGVSQQLAELRRDCLEMAQLKSNFDIEKFTVRKEGNFIAHNFHFLMRQYSLALHELRRMLIEKEKNSRRIAEFEALIASGKDRTNIDPAEGETIYHDLAILELSNENELLELSLVNKRRMCEQFELCRQHLVEANGGKAPTNADYQAEEPQYWEWFLKRQALLEHTAAKTGISSGTQLNIEHLEYQPVLESKYQVPVWDSLPKGDGGQLHLDTALKIWHDEIVREKGKMGDALPALEGE